MIQFMPNLWLTMFFINIIMFFINYINLYFNFKMKF